MKLPEIASKRNRIRDTKIIQLYAQENLTQTEIASRFGIAQRTVSTIIYKNRAFLNADKNLEKVQRINRLKRLELNSDHIKVKDAKDVVMILEQLRKEMEGDKASVQVTNTNVIQVYIPQNDEHIDTISSENLETVDRSADGFSPEHGV